MVLSWRASLGRIVAQGLVSATAAPSPLDAVENLLALQGQQVSAIPWAIGVRCACVSRAQVSVAFDSGALVRSWPMRGTVHVTSARDHHWLRRLLRHRSGAWERRALSLGLDEALVERAAQVACDLLEASPRGVSRADLVNAWESSGIDTVTASSSQTGLRRRHLVMRLHLDGLLAAGPLRAGEHLMIDAQALPGAPGVAKGEAGHEEALAVLAARYAWGHGPIGEADLARWTGLTVTEARRAIAQASEVGDSIGLPIAEFEGGLARSDLADLVEAHRDEAEAMLALPSFDELHVGYKDRSCLTDEAGEVLICPAKNGMFRPIAVARGRLVAVRGPGSDIVTAHGCGGYEELARRVFGDWERWLSEIQQ